MVDFQVGTFSFLRENSFLVPIYRNLKYSIKLPGKIQIAEIFNTVPSFKRSQTSFKRPQTTHTQCHLNHFCLPQV